MELGSGVSEERAVTDLQAEGATTGPCLLVDDMVDSRWTFTVAAWLLREHGAGPVFPLALAQTGQSD